MSSTTIMYTDICEEGTEGLQSPDMTDIIFPVFQIPDPPLKIFCENVKRAEMRGNYYEAKFIIRQLDTVCGKEMYATFNMKFQMFDPELLKGPAIHQPWCVQVQDLDIHDANHCPQDLCVLFGKNMFLYVHGVILHFHRTLKLDLQKLSVSLGTKLHEETRRKMSTSVCLECYKIDTVNTKTLRDSDGIIDNIEYHSVHNADFSFAPRLRGELFVVQDTRQPTQHSQHTEYFSVYHTDTKEVVASFSLFVDRHWGISTPKLQTVPVAQICFLDSQPNSSHGLLVDFVLQYAIDACAGLAREHDFHVRVLEYKMSDTELGRSSELDKCLVNSDFITTFRGIHREVVSDTGAFKVGDISLVPDMQNLAPVLGILCCYNNQMQKATEEAYARLRVHTATSRVPIVIQNRMYHAAFMAQKHRENLICGNSRLAYNLSISQDGGDLVTINVLHGPLIVGTARVRPLYGSGPGACDLYLDTHKTSYFDAYPLFSCHGDDYYFHHRGFGSLTTHLAILYCICEGLNLEVQAINPVTSYIMYGLFHCSGDWESEPPQYKDALQEFHKNDTLGNLDHLLGLEWVQTNQPRGIVIENSLLAQGLGGRLTFTPQEWAAFHVSDISEESTMCVDDIVYRPNAGGVLGLSWTRSNLSDEQNPLDSSHFLHNQALEDALNGRLVFTEDEWSAFGQAGLSKASYICVHSKYYKPIGGGFWHFLRTTTGISSGTVIFTVFPTEQNKRMVEYSIAKFIRDNVTTLDDEQFMKKYLQGPLDTPENNDPTSAVMRMVDIWNAEDDMNMDIDDSETGTSTENSSSSSDSGLSRKSMRESSDNEEEYMRSASGSITPPEIVQ